MSKRSAVAPAVINQEYEYVSVDHLTPHPRNARHSDLGAIYESIKANGFFGACVVQKSTNYVLAGNHRFLAAKEHGVPAVPVIYIDVDDDRALRIMLADNRTSDLATNDNVALASLLAELAKSDNALIGTAFDGDDLDSLIGDVTGGLNLDGDVVSDAGKAAIDNGKNSDGSVWAICPDCGHEFEVKHGKADKAK